MKAAVTVFLSGSGNPGLTLWNFRWKCQPDIHNIQQIHDMSARNDYPIWSLNSSMGVSADYSKETQLSEIMIQLLHKGGYEVIFPENFDKLCCGMAFLSKGFVEAGNKKSKELENALLIASRDGEYPVLCDMSPCLFTMKENMGPLLKLFEPVEFISDYLLPNLIISPIDDNHFFCC